VAVLIALITLKPADATLAEDLACAALVITPLAILLLRTLLPFLPGRSLRHAT
jgi:hypothetical protein